MSYRVNEIFYSLQGEGRHTGRAAVFIRFSGCNLHCPFCDTDFHHFTEMSLNELMSAIRQWNKCGFAVLTGGEPSLQVDDALIDALHDEGYYVAMETNGTHVVPTTIDWVTVSPKNCFVDYGPAIVVQKIDEVKMVFDGQHDPQPFSKLGYEPYLCLNLAIQGTPSIIETSHVNVSIISSSIQSGTYLCKPTSGWKSSKI